MNGKLQSREKIRRILDQLGKGLTDQSVARAREQRFDCWVDRLDHAARIDGKDTVRHRVQDRCAQAFTVDKRKRQTATLADDRTEHEPRRRQSEHEELKSPKSKPHMILSLEPNDYAYLDT